MPFSFDWAVVLEFFTFAVLGMGKVACAFRSPIVQRVAQRSLLPVVSEHYSGGLQTASHARQPEQKRVE